jgi:cellulose synthase/poly-beta-1,6-N-acetylglucosamine synthase-like glycosyltransferase
LRNDMQTVFDIMTSIILVYFFMLNGLYIFLTLLSMIGIYNHRNLTAYVNYKKLFLLPQVKPISIIAPAYNEQEIIIESVESLLSLQYPELEVIVVNDGSTDSTLAQLIETYNLTKTNRIFRKVVPHKSVKGIYVSPSHPKLVVVDKENGKKADAMNAGLNVAQYPLFCAIDSDSLLEGDALLKMVRPFLEDPEHTVAAGGVIRLSNGCRVKHGQVVSVSLPRNSLARFQIIEYFRAFLGGRLGLNMLRSVLIISGAFGLFRKDIALACGGYRPETIGEDMDLVIRIKRYLHDRKLPFRMYFNPDPICWTQGPETIRSLGNQRNRWHRGLIEVIRHNRRMLFNPKYGVTGLFAMPFYLMFEMLGPLVEFTGYVLFAIILALGRINTPFAILFFLLAVVLGVVLSLLSILLEEYSLRRYPRLKEVLTIILYAVLENFAYRQWLAWVRFRAYFDFLKGKSEWGDMDKKGFSRPESDSP